MTQYHKVMPEWMQQQEQLLASHYLLHTFSFRLTPPPPQLTCRNSNLEPQQMSVHFGGDVGCTYTDGVWVGPDEKPCLPNYLFPYYAKLTHGMNMFRKDRCWLQFYNTGSQRGFPTTFRNCVTYA